MIRTIFERKPERFCPREIHIGRTICLSAKDFEAFLDKPCAEYAFFEQHSAMMKQAGDERYDTLLVKGEGRSDGVLVKTEGSSYARYAVYVPEASALPYESLARANQVLADAVDWIVENGTAMTSTGNWVTDFSELEERTGMKLSEAGYLRELLLRMLEDRPEVADVECLRDRFDICYYLDYCPNYIPEEETCGAAEQKAEQGTGQEEEQGDQRLKDLLCTRWENVHLVHAEIDDVPHTIVELDGNTLTEAGRNAWSDVLNAKVQRVYQGYYGLQMELSGIKASRLNAFSVMLGGYCSVEDYEAWVNDPDDDMINQKFSDT